ncbi:MAG TPA: hypothetical protein VJ464_02035 [Blastocatellia bacterium]|nr:hypothetical protein [Blastocatellia bacterium]
MITETAKSLFIVSSKPRLYQALLKGVGSYEALGKRLLGRLKAAYAFRQIEQVKELATILTNIPIKEYQLIGQYYLVWCNCRESVFKAEALENLASQTHTYNAKVLLSRAAIDIYRGKFEAASYFHNEALKTSPAVPDYIYIKLGIAQVKGFEGFHQAALNDIENLIPMMRYAEPIRFFETLNSYATELGAVGRFYEARNIMRAVLASPFAFAYPEWRETGEELRGANRSSVALSTSRYNVLIMPEREASEPRFEPKPARVLDLSKWKKKMVKDDDKGKIDTSNMTAQDMAMKLLELITQNRGDYKQMQKILDYAIKVFSEPRKPSS